MFVFSASIGRIDDSSSPTPAHPVNEYVMIWWATSVEHRALRFAGKTKRSEERTQLYFAGVQAIIRSFIAFLKNKY